MWRWSLNNHLLHLHPSHLRHVNPYSHPNLHSYEAGACMHLNLNNSIKYWFFFSQTPQSWSIGHKMLSQTDAQREPETTDGFNSWRAATGNVGGGNFSQRDVCLWLTKLLKRHLGMSGLKPSTRLAPPRCSAFVCEETMFKNRNSEAGSWSWAVGGGTAAGVSSVGVQRRWKKLTFIFDDAMKDGCEKVWRAAFQKLGS